jgi:DNA-binding response OmpR family regulator
MAARPPRATIIEPACTTAGLSPRSRRSKRFRVLLVEPDARYQGELGSGLAEAGFEVMVVATAEDALAELAEGPGLPQLVVSETELEGMDGFAFCGLLRAEARTSMLPVFLLASQRESFHLELATSVGADDYLTKPVEAQDVVALARLKAGRRSAETAYEAHSARLPLTHVARALLAGTRSGRVVLKDSDGFFAFRGRRVVDAAFQGERGVLAFRRLLCFGSGVYAVSFGPELHRGSLLMDLTFLREQVLPGLSRFERLREVGVPLAARLTVDFPRLAEHLDSLPDEVISLVRLFDGRRTVRSVVLECSLPEVMAYEAITQLFVLGVLAPACHMEERERVLDAPRFFEPMEAEASRVALVAEAQDAEERAAEAHEARQQEAQEREAQEHQARLRAEASPAEVSEASLESASVPASEEPGEKSPRDEAPAEEASPRPPLSVVLPFPTPTWRREDTAARAQPAQVFHLAAGAESSGSVSADKV